MIRYALIHGNKIIHSIQTECQTDEAVLLTLESIGRQEIIKYGANIPVPLFIYNDIQNCVVAVITDDANGVVCHNLRHEIKY